MSKETILNKYESFKYIEDGCDELHYYRCNVLMAMHEYATEAIKQDRLIIKHLAKINHSQDEFGNNVYELDTSLIDIEPINLP